MFGEFEPSLGSVVVLFQSFLHAIKLKQIDYPGGGNNTFATNADGQRMTANDTDGNRRLLHDGGRLVGEQDITSGNFIATYDQGLGGLLTRQTRGAAVSYHHFDGIYSTRQLSDATQVVTDTASFDAWGEFARIQRHDILSAQIRCRDGLLLE